MRIAYVTYEYPPDMPPGGIATYVNQVAKYFSENGHSVEVFCASLSRTSSEMEGDIFVHRIRCNDPAIFRKQIVNAFSLRHDLVPFDLIESPEIHGNGYLIKIKYPDLPLLVKFHMPLFLQMRLINYYTPALIKLRYFLGALRRGQFKFYGDTNYHDDIDYKITMLADSMVSPSNSLRTILIREWKLDRDKVSVIPYPFVAPELLLSIPIKITTSKVITFIGKLNVQKGIVIFVEVIKQIAKKYPDVYFRLVGNDSYYSNAKSQMSDYIINSLKGFEQNYTIKGGLSYQEVMSELSKSDICVFPSIWENFGIVCLEAMSAGRAIVASKNGGWSEMLTNDSGLLVDPLNTQQIVSAISELLDDPQSRVNYGLAAREKVLTRFNQKPFTILENHYYNLINNDC